MTRLRALVGALLLVTVGAVFVYAQEQQILNNILVGVGQLALGTNVSIVGEGTTNDAIEISLRIPDGPADYTFTFPPDGGTAGQQLTTNGSGVTNWTAASSQPDNKVVDGDMNPQEALRAILATPIKRWRYRADGSITTGDFTTQYVGGMAPEMPWAMHYGGTILNPVNTAGYTMAAIQAQQAEIDALRAELLSLREAR